MKRMKAFFSAIGLTLVLTFVIGVTSDVNANDVGNADQGKAKSASCAACHGADGNSVAADYPKLAGQHATYLASTLKAYRDGSRANAIMAGMAAACHQPAATGFGCLSLCPPGPDQCFSDLLTD